MHRSARFAAALAAVVLVLGVAPALAQGTTTAAPTEPVDCGEYEGVECQGWFTDDAGVVDDDERVENAIGRLVARYGNQIAMVIVDDSRGRSPDQFAAEIGDAWGVGTAGVNDGIVVLVDLDERFTAVATGDGIDLPDEDDIAGAGNSFFATGDFEGGMLAIVGSLEQALADVNGEDGGDGGDAGGDGGDPPVATTPEFIPDESGSRGGLVTLGVIGLIAMGGIAATSFARRRSRHDDVLAARRKLIDDDLAKLEPSGYELLRVEDYDIEPAPPAPDVDTAAAVEVLASIESGEDVSDEAATRSVWHHGLVAVIDRPRLESAAEVPLELRASEERGILEGAVQQAAGDALAVHPGDDDSFGVRRQEVQRLVSSLRPHRVAAARQRIATELVNLMASTPVGEALLTDAGTRLLRAAPALDHTLPAGESVAELDGLYKAAETKTDRLSTLYARLPESTTRPAVAAALGDLDDDLDEATTRFEAAWAALEQKGTALKADGLALEAVAALLLLNNDDDDIDDFVAVYSDHRQRGRHPDQAVEYALAGLRTPGETNHMREQAKDLGLPVSITAALLRRRDDGPQVYQALVDELATHDIADDSTRRTIAGILAISLEPSQAMRRWLEARHALGALGLVGAYADVAAAFGASDPRGPRVFALAYAAQRQSLARSTIDDADRFAPELAHEGVLGPTDRSTGERIPAGLGYFDPYTLLFYHWIITNGHGGGYGWEPIYRDPSWSEDRGSWWGDGGGFGGWGGGGGFSGGGGGGSSWDSGGWGGGVSGGSFGGFGGGGGFSGGGGGGSGW